MICWELLLGVVLPEEEDLLPEEPPCSAAIRMESASEEEIPAWVSVALSGIIPAPSMVIARLYAYSRFCAARLS